MKSHQPIVINRPVKSKMKLTNDQSETNGNAKKVRKVRGGCCLRGKRS